MSLTERDAWLDAQLGLSPELPDDVALPGGAVPYLPCPVDAILEAVREVPVREHDVFVDLGSGLGRPALLAHLLTGCRALGVELQPHLVAQARRVAARHGLSDAVRFQPGDAATAELSAGTVFFIYSSFNGAALERVLASLERVARAQRITLCAVDFEVHAPFWRARPSRPGSLTLYDPV
ncbi:MAG: class I SAM-dependent methyltransferase [Archangiaceae bacterium]|nr:class I SAM-dependent methyltransferase [Archangiaceae bacterium]